MATVTINAADLVKAASKQGRVNRNPRHEFSVAFTPWEIQPFMIAPVLPGETMKNLLLQARVITDPVKNPIIGWWHETFLFYVKLRDLDARDDMVEMLMTPGTVLPQYQAHGNTNAGTYDNQGYGHRGPNFVRQCLDRVVAEYFVDEDETAPVTSRTLTAGISPGLPLCKLRAEDTWRQSMKLHSTVPLGEGEDELLGQGMHDEYIPAGFEAHFEQYQHMRSLKLVDITFGDWLKQFGVRVPKQDTAESHRPELLRFSRDWTYPSNTIDPSNGKPSSAVSWSIAERADKDRYFNEPGFVFGVMTARPKIYVGRQSSAAANMLSDAFSWLPAIMQQDPYTSLKKFGPTEGPMGWEPASGVPAMPEDYWVDIRDLFLYGDQFISQQFGPDVADGAIRNPYVSMTDPLSGDPLRKYATAAEQAALFVDANKRRVMCDGVANLTIAGTQRDHT